MNFISILIFCLLILKCRAFMPLRLEDRLLVAMNANNRLNRVSDSLSHEEIIKRGVLKSVTNYLNEINNKKFNRIKLVELKQNITKGISNSDDVFFKFYEKKFCLIGLNPIIEGTLEKNVAIVDFDLNTKNLPYAHFDSNELIGSNMRVMNFTQIILSSLARKDYETARKLTGQVLHTIHDFYSHSNWVEMGNIDKINKLIGTPEFVSHQKFASSSDQEEAKCVSNCKEEIVECDNFYQFLANIFNTNNFKGPIAKCPFSYFKCDDNIVVLDKILTGFVEGSALADGTKVIKPENAMECSHGGALDSSSSKPAKGGINKDSGYYLLSPHADLHLIAANLAIDHTEFFFDQIRNIIGNKEFSKFLRLDPENEMINKICGIFGFADFIFSKTNTNTNNNNNNN